MNKLIFQSPGSIFFNNQNNVYTNTKHISFFFYNDVMYSQFDTMHVQIMMDLKDADPIIFNNLTFMNQQFPGRLFLLVGTPILTFYSF